MTATPMPSHANTSIRDLLGLGGFGTVEYTVGADHGLAHTRTVATVKPDRPGERTDLTLFLARLRAEHDLRPGDNLQLRYDDGKLVVAIITRHA